MGTSRSKKTASRTRATSRGVLTGVAAATAIAFTMHPVTAMADTAPTDPTEAKTVSNDALPTMQIDGVAWTQIVVGNTVYVGGNFKTARPSGSAAGQNTVSQPYLLAYDIRTGEMINSFRPTLNGQVMGLAASDDGSRIYAVGDFTTVNGVNKYRIVALNPSNGSVITSFSPGFDARVRAIAVSGDTVYVGGSFNAVKTSTRTHLAALRASDGAVLDWAPTATGGGNTVTALAVSSDKSKVIVGGNFTQLNGTTTYGLGAVDATTGQKVAWDAGNLITNSGTNAAITSLNNVDGAVYGTGYVFGDGQNGNPKGNLEAVFSADPNSGAVRWVADCHGDHYSAWAANGAVYAVGHAHQCRAVGGFTQTSPNWTFHRALAFSESPYSTNLHNTDGGYYDFGGIASPKPLTWYPELIAGTFTGQGQAAWSVSGNSDYIVLGGEFTYVNGKAQQGLTRFARTEIAPNKSGAALSGQNYLPALSSPVAGLVKGRIPANYDNDNEMLTYNVYRRGLANPIYTTQVRSTFYNRPDINFSDDSADLQAGQTYSYRVAATDPFGNTVTGDWTDVTVGSGSMSNYGLRILNDNSAIYYRLDDTSGTTVKDAWGANNGTIVGTGITQNAAGAIQGDSDTAYTFPGTNSFVASPNVGNGTNNFAVEAWIKTNTTRGGKIIGFGNANSGDSSNYDRHVYMLNNGKLSFGVYPGQVKTVTSSASYNDNKWHHVVAQLSSAGMELYVDGVRVGNDPSVTTAQDYSGYWRIGGDNLNGWTNQPTSSYFAGSIDDVAIYNTPLTANQIQWHYSLSGWGTPPPNALPTASFTANPGVRTATFDGSGSTDTDGTIASYSWDFGDGQTGTGVNPTHAYAIGGSYIVKLTVTDDRGGQNTTQQTVVVADPPPNQAPTAAFSATGGQLTASFDASASSDSDGTVASYAWDFGDGQTGTGKTATHNYTSGGIYHVTLTVTDNQGATGTLTQDVVVTDPPPNQPPTAAFTATGGELTASFDASASSDSDGTVVSYAWDFGDGQTGTGKTATHAYSASGTYPVTLTVTDNQGASTQLTQNVVVNPLSPAIAFDDFARTVANGWGSIAKGGAWTTSGSAANFSVDGSAGVITIPTAGQTRGVSLNSLSVTSTDATADITLDRPVVGSSYVSLQGRRVNANTDYRLKLRFFENGDVNATLVKFVNGTETQIAGGRVTGMVFNSGDTVHLRLQVSGQGTTTLKAKVWKNTDTEPVNWSVQGTDSTAALQVAGGIGFQVYAAGTQTNLPYPVKFDNLNVIPVA